MNHMDNKTARSLPHNEEAERCLLASLLLNPQAISECIEKFASLDPDTRGSEYFYNANHGLIYRTLVDMCDEHEPVDLKRVTQKLASRDQLERVGGVEAITQLFEAVPTASNLNFYLDIVCQRYQLRQLIQVATEILEKGYDTPDEGVAAFVGHVEGLLFNATHRRSTQPVVSSEQIIHEAIHEIDDILLHKGELRGMPTGFTKLDEHLDGLQRGSMIVIAARPSLGKSSLTMNIAEHVAIFNLGKQVPIGIFSLVLPALQVILRMLCSIGEVSMNRVRRGLSTDVEYKSLITAAEKIRQAKIFIDDTSCITITELRAKARRMKINHDIQLLVVDGLEHVRAPMRGGNNNRQQEIAAISDELKSLARELHIPIIVVAPLNRALENHEGGALRLSDLLGSTEIEQDADVVCLIDPKNDGTDDEIVVEDVTQVELILAKNRNGPEGRIPLQFRRDICRFFSADTDETDLGLPSREEIL